MQELIKALIKAKAEFNPIQKDGTNPHYKRKYATLDAVLDAVTPTLGKHGLVIIQTTEIFEGKTVLRTHIFHESGESIASTYPLPEISDSQKLGAALTYARRYAVCAILSVTADEDDDAESANNPKKAEQPQNNIRPRKDNQQPRLQPTKQAITPPSINPKDLRVKEVRTLLNYSLDLVKEWLHSRNVTSPSELDSVQIDELVKTMCLAWAGNKFGHPNHAANSYQKHVVDAVARGVDETTAISDWMEGALAQLPELN
ncbi:Essential recombination function protein (plasmid) [Nostoc flagelliforme CCNUN1]|uniref:Essential recombination function protein n=2 Tax=Nostoc flagelliforme TaxID=1306274 RepID=A0A2K8TAQ7_9NOSO|nr:ERF family protein [Nostoc flagelliforme]ADO19041.1 ERF family protein [Nostoc flagelliforme str. Sunitezuoqi]AUB44750.1 Essential recombination function protein [Nostoc flagelliforme CCNUN1]